MPDAVCASIGCTGRKSCTSNRERSESPPASAARATGARLPAIITARRMTSGDTLAARATASARTDSSAPCRSSPKSRRIRKSCSSAVARCSRSRRRRTRSTGEPRPVIAAMLLNTSSTSPSRSTGAGAEVSGFASRIAEPPMPIRPCRGSPDRKAMAISISAGSTRRSSDASWPILERRALASATAVLCLDQLVKKHRGPFESYRAPPG